MYIWQNILQDYIKNIKDVHFDKTQVKNTDTYL